MREELSNILDIIRPLDDRARIIGSFLIERSPISSSRVPKNIADTWVGLELPVRYPRLIAYNEIIATPGDIVASLLAQQQEEQAAWFKDDTTNMDMPLTYPYWSFYTQEGKTALDSAVSTDAYYTYLQNKWR